MLNAPPFFWARTDGGVSRDVLRDSARIKKSQHFFILFFFNDVQFTLPIFRNTTLKNSRIICRTSKAQTHYWPTVDGATQAAKWLRRQQAEGRKREERDGAERNQSSPPWFMGPFSHLNLLGRNENNTPVYWGIPSCLKMKKCHPAIPPTPPQRISFAAGRGNTITDQ